MGAQENTQVCQIPLYGQHHVSDHQTGWARCPWLENGCIQAYLKMYAVWQHDASFAVYMAYMAPARQCRAVAALFGTKHIGRDFSKVHIADAQKAHVGFISSAVEQQKNQVLQASCRVARLSSWIFFSQLDHGDCC